MHCITQPGTRISEQPRPHCSPISPASDGSERPLPVDVAGGGEGQVDGAEEEVRGRQADHEQRRRVRPQLGAPQQRHHRQEVAWKKTEIRGR